MAREWRDHEASHRGFGYSTKLHPDPFDRLANGHRRRHRIMQPRPYYIVANGTNSPQRAGFQKGAMLGTESSARTGTLDGSMVADLDMQETATGHTTSNYIHSSASSRSRVETSRSRPPRRHDCRHEEWLLDDNPNPRLPRRAGECSTLRAVGESNFSSPSAAMQGMSPSAVTPSEAAAAAAT